MHELLKLDMEICKGGGEKELDGIENAAMGDDDRNVEARDITKLMHVHNASFFFFWIQHFYSTTSKLVLRCKGLQEPNV